jgi:hypothetical protein
MKAMIIILLLLAGFHLLLYGYVRRRIAAAKQRAEAEQSGEDAKRNTGGDNRY